MVTRLRAAEAVIGRVTTACKSSPPVLPRTLIRGRKVVTLGEIVMIQNLKSEGLSISQIAARTGLDRKTVRKYLDRGLEAPVYGPRQPRERVIAPYEAYLRGRITNFPDLSGKRLFREIKSQGYKGGYTAVTDFLREARPPQQASFERRFETPPGQQAQVDFAEFKVEFTDGEEEKRSFRVDGSPDERHHAQGVAVFHGARP